MFSEKKLEKYKFMDTGQINQEFVLAVEFDKYNKIKNFIETETIHIYAHKISFALFHACSNDNLQLFKYLMFKQKRFDLNTIHHWNESFINACGGHKGGKVIEFIFNSPLAKVSFSENLLYTAFLSTHNNLKALECLIDKNKIKLDSYISKNNFQYLEKLVKESCLEVIEYLAYKHEVNFLPFKGKERVYNNNSDKISDIFKKQDFFFNLKDTLTDQESKAKTKKI